MSIAINKILSDENLLDEVTRKCFREVDKNNSGKIDLKELKDILYQISVDFGAESPTDEEVAKVLEILDKDKNHTIELKEFQILISDVLRAMLEQDKKD